MQAGTIWIIWGYIIIAGGLLVGSLVVHHGNKINQEFSEKRILAQTKKSENVILKQIEYLKNVIIKGDEQLVKQIAKPQVQKSQQWNFEQGTIVFHLLEDDLFNGKEKKLTIVSEDKQASIEFYKNMYDVIAFEVNFSGVAHLKRNYQITYADVTDKHVTLMSEKKEFRSVFIGFAWNLIEKTTTLWIDGVEI